MRIIGDRLFIDLPGSGEPSPDGRIDGGTAWGTHLTDIAATGLLLGTTSDMETVAMMLDVSKRVADPASSTRSQVATRGRAPTSSWSMTCSST